MKELPIEITVIVKGEDKTYKQKFLEYCSEKCITLSRECEGLTRMVEEAVGSFCGNPEDVIVNARFSW